MTTLTARWVGTRCGISWMIRSTAGTMLVQIATSKTPAKSTITLASLMSGIAMTTDGDGNFDEPDGYIDLPARSTPGSQAMNLFAALRQLTMSSRSSVRLLESLSSRWTATS